MNKNTQYVVPSIHSITSFMMFDDVENVGKSSEQSNLWNYGEKKNKSEELVRSVEGRA